jgi:hypothetical protein
MVSALATRLVCYGARIVYGGNLDQRGFTYQLYPAIAQAYATAALRAARPPFIHYVAAYLAKDPLEVAAHLNAVGSFAEVRLVDCNRGVTQFVMSGGDMIVRSSDQEFRVRDVKALRRVIGDLPRQSAGQVADLDAMRIAMEEDLDARILLGGRISNFAGRMPGVLQEAILTLERGHLLTPLGGFGGAARDAAIALGLLPQNEALNREEGREYRSTLATIKEFAGKFRENTKAPGIWEDLVAASKADNPDIVSTHVVRALLSHSVRS